MPETGFGVAFTPGGFGTIYDLGRLSWLAYITMLILLWILEIESASGVKTTPLSPARY